MRAYTLEAYEQAGCPMQKTSSVIFAGLHEELGGKVCDTGCSMFRGGGCKAYQVLLRPSERAVQQASKEETVREEAARCGLSINEVRRRRRAGV